MLPTKALRVMGQLAHDMANYGSMRYLVTNTREEFAIQRIHPDAYITVEMDEDDIPQERSRNSWQTGYV